MTGDAYNYISTAVFTLVIIIMVQFVCVIYNLVFFWPILLNQQKKSIYPNNYK